MTEQVMLQRIKQNIHEVDPQAEAWLYGSMALATAHEESDWDVMVQERLVLTFSAYIPNYLGGVQKETTVTCLTTPRKTLIWS